MDEGMKKGFRGELMLRCEGELLAFAVDIPMFHFLFQFTSWIVGG